MLAIGWMCFCAAIGYSLALHAISSADCFQIVFISHAVLIMPAYAFGLVAMLHSLSAWTLGGLGLESVVTAHLANAISLTSKED